MASNNAVNLQNVAGGFQSLPVLRQIALLIGLSVSVAIGFYVVLWAKEPNWSPLYSHLELKDTNLAVDALNQAKIRFKLDPSSGTVLVPSEKLHDAKIELAAKSIPTGSSYGLEILEKSNGFGTSQFIEMARYLHAIEGELAKTISSFSKVEKARVHLAVPKTSGFLKDKKEPSASVLVNLYPGFKLSSKQVQAIVHLVASSVPGLNHERVTVASQDGGLLYSGGKDDFMVAKEQYDIINQLENSYSQRIIDILTPVLGPNRVMAEVTIDADFTANEETQEKYDPNNQVVRSERNLLETKGTNSNETSGGGVPGSLGNKSGSEGSQNKQSTGSETKQTTKNYELDRLIRHTKHAPSKINRLSASVVLDDKFTIKDDGEETKVPLTEEELVTLTGLVKDAIGFNKERGDKVTVVNKAFATMPKIADLPPKQIFEQPWFFPVVKQVLAGLLILIIIFVVIRPILKSLAVKQKTNESLVLNYNEDGSPGREYSPNQRSKSQHMDLELNSDSAQNMDRIKQMINHDPKRAAQVVKDWVGDDE